MIHDIFSHNNMGVDNLSITLRRCDDDLIIKTCNVNDETPENTYKFQLSSLFTLLEEGELTKIQSSLTKITSLDLSYCNLSELPKCIKFLHLKSFNISHNNFTQVPSCLYGNGLQKLESLDMSYNKLGQFDIEPDCVLALKRLNLNNNCFVNVPKWFLTFRCTNLEEFNYSDNKANHYNFLKNSYNLNLMKLKKLEVKNSCLLDQDLPWIKCFKLLNYIDISNKSISGDVKYINKFRQLEKLFDKPTWKAMEVLKINFLDISFLPEGVYWIECLKELHITNNLLSWLPDGLEYLINLELLDVSNNQLVFIPKQISHLPNLKILLASGNQLEEIPEVPNNLEVLDLYDNRLEIFNNEELEHVATLDLEYNYIDLKVEQDIYYASYCSKRDTFRDLYKVNDRCSGTKSRPEYDNYSSDRSSDLDDELWNNYNSVDDATNTSIPRIETPDEDWDRENIKTPAFRHPDISLSDHEYDGEKELISPQPFSRKPIDNEDYLFIDAD